MANLNRAFAHALTAWLLLGTRNGAAAQAVQPPPAPPGETDQSTAEQERLARDKVLLERRADKSIHAIDLNLPAVKRRTAAEHGEPRKQDEELQVRLLGWRKQLVADVSALQRATRDSWDTLRLAVEKDIVATDDELARVAAPEGARDAGAAGDAGSPPGR